MPGEPELVLHKRSHANEKPGRQVESNPRSEQLEKSPLTEKKTERRQKQKKKKRIEMGVEWPKGVSGRPCPLILSPLNPKLP